MTLWGIVIVVREVHFSKARFPIAVTLSGIMMEVSILHSKKAHLSILLTPSGMVVLWQPQTRASVSVWMIAWQFCRLSYMVLPSATTIEVRRSQPAKAPLPILVTLSGIVMLVSEEQVEKAPFPIVITLFGIAMDANDEQR